MSIYLMMQFGQKNLSKKRRERLKTIQYTIDLLKEEVF